MPRAYTYIHTYIHRVKTDVYTYIGVFLRASFYYHRFFLHFPFCAAASHSHFPERQILENVIKKSPGNVMGHIRVYEHRIYSTPWQRSLIILSLCLTYSPQLPFPNRVLTHNMCVFSCLFYPLFLSDFLLLLSLSLSARQRDVITSLSIRNVFTFPVQLSFSEFNEKLYISSSAVS